ncbi:MAG TPA: tetratricopeptide repeat protein [Micromonospora sp.]
MLRAEALAYSIADPERKAWALTNLANTLAKRGHLDRAEHIARSITNPIHQAWVLTTLANTLAERGHLDRAEHIAQQAEQADHTLTNPSDQAWVLSDLASTLAKCGQLDRAEHITRTITDPGAIPEAVAAVITHLDRARARRLLAWAMTKTELRRLFPAIGDFDPTLLLRIADEFER